MMANNSFAKRCFVDGELWSNATYNTSSSTRKSAMCNFETTPVLCANLHECAGEGSRHFSAFHFVSGMPSSLYDTLNEDWAPSKNLGYSLVRDDHTISKGAMERHARASERAARKRNREEIKMLNDGNNIEREDNSSSGETNTVETQTTLYRNHGGRSERYVGSTCSFSK